MESDDTVSSSSEVDDDNLLNVTGVIWQASHFEVATLSYIIIWTPN
jgi:hypothetical protein